MMWTVISVKRGWAIFDGGPTWTFPGVINRGIFPSDLFLIMIKAALNFYYNRLTNNPWLFFLQRFLKSTEAPHGMQDPMRQGGVNNSNGDWPGTSGVGSGKYLFHLGRPPISAHVFPVLYLHRSTDGNNSYESLHRCIISPSLHFLLPYSPKRKTCQPRGWQLSINCFSIFERVRNREDIVLKWTSTMINISAGRFRSPGQSPCNCFTYRLLRPFPASHVAPPLVLLKTFGQKSQEFSCKLCHKNFPLLFIIKNGIGTENHGIHHPPEKSMFCPRIRSLAPAAAWITVHIIRILSPAHNNFIGSADSRRCFVFIGGNTNSYCPPAFTSPGL